MSGERKKKILLIKLSSLGDVIFNVPLANALKDAGAEKITMLSANPEKTSRLYGVESSGMLNFFIPIFCSDVLISGGGSLLQDITSFKRLFYYLVVSMTALVLGNKVIIFAQGFSKFRTKTGKFLTRFVLKRCHQVTVRDRQSQEYLTSLGIESTLVADPVFGITVPSVSEHRGIGVQLRNCRGLGNEFLIPLAEEIAKQFKNQERQKALP